MNDKRAIRQIEVDALIDKYGLSPHIGGGCAMQVIGEQGAKKVCLVQVVPTDYLYDEYADELLNQVRLHMWDKMSHMMSGEPDWSDGDRIDRFYIE